MRLKNPGGALAGGERATARRASTRVDSPAQRRPLPYAPERKPPDRLPQDRDIVRDEQEPKGQHPDSEERQDRENASENQQEACRNADPASVRMA
jgi:hypothetical protein